MRVADISLPLLAVISSANAQGLDFAAIFKADPALKNVKPTPTPVIDKQATASHIISSLKSVYTANFQTPSHASTLVTSTKKAATTTTKAAVTSSAKAAATTKQTTTTTATTKGSAKPSAGKEKRQAASSATATTTTSSSPTATLCSSQTYLYKYASTPNTDVGFSVDSTLGTIATNAQAPAGYTRKFTAQSASIFNDPQYLTYFELSSYDVNACAAYCSSWAGCSAYNLYFERDPTLVPGPSCVNPTAAVSVKCALWKNQPTLATANNYGEFRSQFAVLVAGSNLYWKNTAPAAIASYSGPTALAGLVNVTAINGQNVTAGTAFYPGTYQPSLCAALCSATNVNNSAAASAAGKTTYTPCNYFDAATLSVNGVAAGTYCALYTTSAVASYATLYTQSNNGVSYDVSYSYAYTSSTNNTGVIVPATSAAFYIQVVNGTAAGQYLTYASQNLSVIANKTSADTFKINNTNSYLFDTKQSNSSYVVNFFGSSTSGRGNPLFATNGVYSAASQYSNVAASWNLVTNALTFASSTTASPYSFELCGSSLSAYFDPASSAANCQTVALLAVAA